MEQQEEDEQLPPTLRSIHNRHSSFVKFINTTRHNIGVYWIDYQGKMVCYRVLGCRDHVEINTFVTHPWIFVDEETKDRFPGNGEEVFFPEPWFAKYRGMRPFELPARIERTPVYITLPLYSLRDLCLREIKRRLRYDWQAFDLEIPWSLQHELHVLQPRKPEQRDRDLGS
ncbi:PREDICTED: protein Vhl [Ceratosolen solmsi marchali]|uniref:Protein Vhl n=1 Tax=Ceratosolen solmsi marchali TaxID=326594 RepID=A0AAJ6YJX6_9HYME|nr:PREDICTED: protein Vhl [Ceratosolen solmsi marchali]